MLSEKKEKERDKKYAKIASLPKAGEAYLLYKRGPDENAFSSGPLSYRRRELWKTQLPIFALPLPLPLPLLRQEVVFKTTSCIS